MCLIRAYTWYGGKLRVAYEIGFLIPKHRAMYEPFMGSAALTLNSMRSEIEVINDLDPDLVCFMKIMTDREKGKRLLERLNKLWYDEWLFKEAMQHKCRNFEGLDEIERAAMVYVLITQSFNSTRKGFSKKGYKDTFAYRKDILLHAPRVYERMQGVRVLNMNGIDLLEKISDNSSAFAFVDPPYRKELRGKNAGNVYACELPHAEQIRLLTTIQDAKCKIMLCGYKSNDGVDLYDTYLLSHGWHCYKLANLVKSCQNKDKKDIGEEFIWVNYTLPESAKYIISMKEHRTI